MKEFKKNQRAISIICDLDLKKYLGKWYEIGRLPMRAENGLDNVTAVYSLKKNGKIEVLNIGYKNGERKSITGTAWVPNKKCKGGLFVRFFWPFKSEYNVIKLEENYRYSVVMGDNKDSLWILNRTPHMDTETYKEIIDFLDHKGFNVANIISVKQDKK